ncbi:MAG: DUF2795 domain-containing protein [Alphaproteobacteria bacterium]|nr:DUF2795 domain-containing protein [Alphaproteobacteria bacterium]MBV9376249.1 DUF2795 domain-containing protein [Alphaproteobacteria bacterium]
MSYSAYDETHLPTAVRVGSRRTYSRMSWGSVLAGAVVAGASMILLSLLGVAIGAGGLLFTQTTAADMAGYGLGAGIWTAVNLILSMGFGAYVAARLSGTHSHLDAELHGITVWGVAILFMTVLLAHAVGAIIGTVASTAGTAASSAVSGAGSLASGVAQQVSPKGLVDQLQETLTSSGDPTQMTRAQINGEIATLAGRRIVNGSLTDQERDRLTTLVAADAGISKEEAARRVARMEQDATAALANTEQQARKAAETAARGAAAGAKALFSALLLSLAGALVGAWLGTRHARVLTPHEPEYDTHTTTTVTHHAYEPAVTTHAVHEPVVVTPSTVRVHDEAAATVPAYLRGASFPATKQDLLRLARANNAEPVMLRRVEQLADRSYSSLNDLTSALLATV